MDLTNPAVTPVLIAHSHGGNVVLRAMNYLRASEVDISRVKIVTLATPFLRVFTREPHLTIVTWFLLFAAIAGLFSIVAALLTTSLLAAFASLSHIVADHKVVIWLLAGAIVI